MSTPSECLTLTQAAKVLEVSEKTVRRLISAGTLAAEKEPGRGGFRYQIPRCEVERYKLRDWVNLQMCEFALGEKADPAHASLGSYPTYFRFGPWDGRTRLPRFELPVSLEDFWRLAYNTDNFRAAENELRARLPDHPTAFYVRFILDYQKVAKTLQGLVRRVRPPRLPGKTAADLQSEALEHLILKALPQLHRVHQEPSRYLLRTVKNFYREECRRTKVSREIPSEAADLPVYDEPE